MLNKRLCLGNLSTDWATTESENTELYGRIYDFVVDYQKAGSVKEIYDMHRYLMKNMIYNM